jgi:hypothetical protein
MGAHRFKPIRPRLFWVVTNVLLRLFPFNGDFFVHKNITKRHKKYFVLFGWIFFTQIIRKWDGEEWMNATQIKALQ